MANAQTVETDEFDEAAEAQAALSGYEATCEADVEDPREYRMVPRGTPCTLIVQGFELSSKGKPAIWAKIGVVEPEEFADGSSTFNLRLSLNPQIGTKEDGTDKKGSGFTMTANQLSWIYASANQCSSTEAKQVMIKDVFAEFPNMSPDDAPFFHAALVENANEELPKGTAFKTKGIGIDVGGDDGKGGKYRDKQALGAVDYPRSKK